jgi:hypothetical protein
MNLRLIKSLRKIQIWRFQLCFYICKKIIKAMGGTLDNIKSIKELRVNKS